MEKLDDEMLDGINGGTSLQYNMDNDPLYNRFSSMREKENEDKEKNGMESRAAFIGSFGRWVNGGRPNQNVASNNGKKG
jgi:hypothetical protein